MPLQYFPDELLVLIIPFLDPIALISLSQTKRHFRHLIQPTKRHFIERLLVLECLEAHGGPYLDVRQRNLSFHPSADDELKHMRWACAGCLKLRSHRHFNNKALYQLKYKKPTPNTKSAESLALTSWMPLMRGVKSAQKHRFSAQPEERTLRRYLGRYSGSYTDESIESWYHWLRSHGASKVEGSGLHDMDLDEFKGIARYYNHMPSKQEYHEYLNDSRNHGFARLKRMCNECLFQTGQLQRIRNGRAGSALTPIQPSRRVYYYSALDRWLPRFSEGLEHKRPLARTPRFLESGPVPFSEPWALYMVRCSGCEQWKELRTFRLSVCGPRWSPIPGLGKTETGPNRHTRGPVHLDGAHCHTCYAKENGKEKLGEDLANWASEVIEEQLRRHLLTLSWGYRRLNTKRVRPAIQVEEVNDILKNVHLHEDVDPTEVDEAVTGWITQYPQVKKMWDEARARDISWSLIREASLDVWIDKFQSIVDYWFWLRAAKEEIQQAPGRLVEWALDDRGDEEFAVSKSMTKRPHVPDFTPM
ncbi:unnamed protein product [Clonostachys rosea]|uniref:F-box domain-containing protein n=1 Tax=Bionectria ochroleuca TaxID=29856 RepID=A0ABY6UMS6_BIOOC|nr:unnamed protein product [Clonostachys rosea]